MIAELGHFAQILGLALAVALAVVPAWGAWAGNRAAMQLATGLATGMTVFVGIAFACLATVFLRDDFSVALVANNSNTLLPAIYFQVKRPLNTYAAMWKLPSIL